MKNKCIIKNYIIYNCSLFLHIYLTLSSFTATKTGDQSHNTLIDLCFLLHTPTIKKLSQKCFDFQLYAMSICITDIS